MKIYKAAIIGCGAVAGGYDLFPPQEWTGTHAGGYRLCTNTDIWAACDIAPTVLSEFGKKWAVQRLYRDYQEMLESERPDIVSICLPTIHHFEAYRSACRAGVRAIFLEKPVSSQVEQAWDMEFLGKGRPIAVNYFRRWNPTLKTLKEELQTGIYGNPLRVTVHYVKGLIENGSHFVDLLRWFFGEPASFKTLRVFQRPQDDPAVDFEMVWPSGLIATFLHMPETKYVFHEVDIFTDQARVTIGQRGQSLSTSYSVEEPHFKKFQILKNDTPPIETEWRNCTLRAISELVTCMETGGQPSCKLEDGVKTLEICKRILSRKKVEQE